VPWQGSPRVKVRDIADLDPSLVDKTYIVHRNLDYDERVVDSNERELLAAWQLLNSCARFWSGLVVTLYFDNINASIICGKGSPKPRLQKYAVRIADLLEKYNIEIKPIWIPRDLNFVADAISKTIDYDDHGVTQDFFHQVCGEEEVTPRWTGLQMIKTQKLRFFIVLFSAL